MAFSELNDSSGSFSYITPSSDLDIDDATLGKLLTEAHRGQSDYCNPEGVSVSQSLLSVVFDRAGKPAGERDVDQSIGFGVTRNTYSAHSKFSENTQAEKVVDRSGKTEERNSSNAKIRTLLDEQRQMIIVEFCEKIGHHELQAAHAEEERRILREELWRQQMDFREVHQQSLTEMEELRKFQSSTFDTLARRKLIEDQNTIMELSGRVQELQNEANCMNDSKDFQDAESVRSGTSHVTSRPMAEQLNARRGAERALVEDQNRIAQLDGALQQGGRPGTAAGQVVDTRVLGRPDRWDGSEKAWPNWSFVMKAYAGAIDQDLSADMTTAECSTDAMSNDAMTGERKARSVQLHFVLIMLCTGRALDRIANAPHGWGMEARRTLFLACSPKNNARFVVMMLEVLAFLLDTNDVVNSLETMERKIKEFERFANIEIPEFLKIGIVIRQADEGPMRTHLIMNSHRLTTFQDIKTEVTNVKQAQSAVKATSGDAMDVDLFTKGSKGASKGSGKKQDSEAVCWYCKKKGRRASACRKKQRDNDSGKSKGSKKGYSKREEQQGTVHRQMLQLWQDRSHVKGLKIQRNECIRSWRRVGRGTMHRNGKVSQIRVNPRVADTHRALMAGGRCQR